MIELDEKALETVQHILRLHASECRVVVFGSRVGTGKARKYSDLDIALKSSGKLDWRKLEAIKDAFSETDLPFSVDVLDYQDVSKEFQTIIEQTGTSLQIE